LCLAKTTIPKGPKYCRFGRVRIRTLCLPLWVFILALAVEVGQYFDFVALLGLGDIAFFRILLGSTFSLADIICYGAGCLIFALTDFIGFKHD